MQRQRVRFGSGLWTDGVRPPPWDGPNRSGFKNSRPTPHCPSQTRNTFRGSPRSAQEFIPRRSSTPEFPTALMPTYTYRREDGTTFEVQQKITEDALEECPDTGQDVERIITDNAGVIFKGEGFHVNDYDDHGPSDDE